MAEIQLDDSLKFQFTPLREGRLGVLSLVKMEASSFNSRPCERGDGYYGI